MSNETLPSGSSERKNIPLCSGVLDYFPAALAEVAKVSKAGNDKHNPGEPLHWSREKSNDHADCILRHLVDRGKVDPGTGQLHSAELAWRALALLQEELEARGAPIARNATTSPPSLREQGLRDVPPIPLTEALMDEAERWEREREDAKMYKSCTLEDPCNECRPLNNHG